MEFNIENWLAEITGKLHENFGENLIFTGLQGSYKRKEASAESDIDLVVLLEHLDFNDLKIYKKIIETMPFKEKSCGFISGRKEIQNWSKQDLFQFYYDTKPLYGKLEDIISPPSVEDVKISLKTSAENLYHNAVHSFLHSNDLKNSLKELYKITFFILQAKYFVQNNKYIPTKKELLEVIENEDKEILEICINKSLTENKDIELLYSKLIAWCTKIIIN